MLIFFPLLSFEHSKVEGDKKVVLGLSREVLFLHPDDFMGEVKFII